MPGCNLVLGICFVDATVHGTRFSAYLSICMGGGGCVLIVCFVDATVRGTRRGAYLSGCTGCDWVLVFATGRAKKSAFRVEVGKPIFFCDSFPSYFASIARAEVTTGEDATEDSEACSGVYGTLPEFPETRRRPRQSNFWCGFLT